MKKAKIFMYDRYAGLLTEDENGFSFVYDAAYLQAAKRYSDDRGTGL